MLISALVFAGKIKPGRLPSPLQMGGVYFPSPSDLLVNSKYSLD